MIRNQRNIEDIIAIKLKDVFNNMISLFNPYYN